jgi:hypothetical protein
MRTQAALGTLLAALTLALAGPAAAAPGEPKPACEDGKTLVRGECVVACPKEGAFKAAYCECPEGFGKVYFGNGAGECKPLVCPKEAEFSGQRECACAKGSKKKPTRDGNVRCVAAKKA